MIPTYIRDILDLAHLDPEVTALAAPIEEAAYLAALESVDVRVFNGHGTAVES